MVRRLLDWTIDLAFASEPNEIQQGSVVNIEGSGPALVTGLIHDRIELAPLSARRPRPDALVHVVGPLVVPVTVDDRTIDPLGIPLDDGPSIVGERVAIFGRDPAVGAVDRKRLTLGSLVWDLQHVFRSGASFLATGPRLVLRHILRHQAGCGRTIIYATAGATPAKHIGTRVRPIDEPGFPCIHVAVVDPTPALQWLVPWTAMAIASALRERGRDVVVAIDDIDAWRPHVLRFSARGGWSTQLAQLSSRAYSTRDGSVSLIAMTRHVDATRMMAFDHQIDFSQALRGRPSPTNTKWVRPPTRVVSIRRLGAVMLNLAQAAEIEDLAPSYGNDALGTTEVVAEAQRIRECIRMRLGGTVDSLEQTLALLAVLERPDLPTTEVVSFSEAFLARIRERYGDVLEAARKAGRIDERVILADARNF